jgi:hypothetical protein
MAEGRNTYPTPEDRKMMQEAADRGELSGTAAAAKQMADSARAAAQGFAARARSIDRALQYANNPNCKAQDLLWLAQEFYKFLATEDETEGP